MRRRKSLGKVGLRAGDELVVKATGPNQVEVLIHQEGFVDVSVRDAIEHRDEVIASLSQRNAELSDANKQLQGKLQALAPTPELWG